MEVKDTNRRDFVKGSSALLAATAVSWNASSYAAILGANDRVKVGVVGCGDRMKSALIPAFLQNCQRDELRVRRRLRHLESPPRRRRSLHSEAQRKPGGADSQQRRTLCAQGCRCGAHRHRRLPTCPARC